MMSKYEPLWEHVGKTGESDLTMSFDQIEQILGFPIDHSFLNYKKELEPRGYEVEKISLKNKTVRFKRIDYNYQCGR